MTPRFGAHRLILLRAALAAALALLTAPSACCPEDTVDEIFLLHDPGADLQPLIDACRDPVHPDCLPLCRALVGQSIQTFEHCELHPERDGYVQVHAGYYGGVCGG